MAYPYHDYWPWPFPALPVTLYREDNVAITLYLVDLMVGGEHLAGTPALEYLLPQTSLVFARRKAPSLSRQESLLLQKINRGLPATTQQRYDALRAKLHNETIAADEYQELLDLIDEVELADANRLQALIELAHLRNVSLAEIMNQLGIPPPQPIYG